MFYFQMISPRNQVFKLYPPMSRIFTIFYNFQVQISEERLFFKVIHLIAFDTLPGVLVERKSSIISSTLNFLLSAYKVSPKTKNTNLGKFPKISNCHKI